MQKRANPIGALVLLSVMLATVIGLGQVALALEVGERAPDFKLPSTTGEDISLSQFRGKRHILLEFYLSDFGPN